MANEHEVVFTQLTALEPQRGVARPDKLWPNGTRLGIVFLNGTDEQRQLVMDAANEWSEYANISFYETDNMNAPVRVTFNGDGYWAYVGTDVHTALPYQPTLSLAGILYNEPYKESYGAALHELGHILGLTHEHFSPESPVIWNVDAVYRYYRDRYGWDKETIDHNVLARVPVTYPHTGFDENSIMLYPIPTFLTVDNHGVPRRNHVLSDIDKEFIGKLYPKQD